MVNFERMELNLKGPIEDPFEDPKELYRTYKRALKEKYESDLAQLKAEFLKMGFEVDDES